MGMIDKTISAVLAMNAEEQSQVVARLIEAGIVKAPVKQDADDVKPRRSGRGRRPYWLKTVTGWNDSKKGGYGIVGDMVWRPEDLTPGTKLAARLRDGDNTVWMIVEVKHGDEVSYRGDAGTITIPGVAAIGKNLNNWESFKARAKSLGMGT